jgi:hypothetical protein
VHHKLSFVSSRVRNLEVRSITHNILHIDEVKVQGARPPDHITNSAGRSFDAMELV